MNLVVQTVRPTKDPEVRYSQGENSICVARFQGAVNRRFKKANEPDADFFTYVVFGKVAETIEKCVRKGTKIIVTGEIRNNNYTDKNGQKVYGQEIVVSSFEFCESKSASQGSGNAQNSNAQPAPSSTGDGFMNIPDGIDEELPFN